MSLGIIAAKQARNDNNYEIKENQEEKVKDENAINNSSDIQGEYILFSNDINTDSKTNSSKESETNDTAVKEGNSKGINILV